MDREAWWATVHGVAESGTRLSDFTSLWLIHNVVLVSGIQQQIRALHKLH